MTNNIVNIFMWLLDILICSLCSISSLALPIFLLEVMSSYWVVRFLIFGIQVIYCAHTHKHFTYFPSVGDLLCYFLTISLFSFNIFFVRNFIITMFAKIAWRVWVSILPRFPNVHICICIPPLFSYFVFFSVCMYIMEYGVYSVIFYYLWMGLPATLGKLIIFASKF